MGKIAIAETQGTMYGALEVIGPAKPPEKAKQKSGWWLCKCVCGNVVPVWGTYLRANRARHCGCGSKPKGYRAEDDEVAPGYHAGMLEVIRKAPRPDGDFGVRYTKSSWWLCRCDCGKEVVKPHVYLKQTAVPNCGCKRGEQQVKKPPNGEMRARKQACAVEVADQGRKMYGVSRNDKMCGTCGKLFDAYAGPDWAYKRPCGIGRMEYYCSYGCMRRHDREKQARRTKAHI